MTAKENRLNTFQDQEIIKDLDLNWVQFKWRNHDPSIGRFFNVDPLAEKFYHLSTYAFSGNQVTAHIELEGLEPIRAPLPSARPRLFRSSGGNRSTISETAAEAARQRSTGFATIGRSERGTFRRTTTYSTSRGEGSRVGAGNSFGRSENAGGISDRTHNFGNNAGNFAKVLIDVHKTVNKILDNAESIQVTESFAEADGASFSLGLNVSVENMGTTMLLSDLEGQYNQAVIGLAQGDLSDEEWQGLSDNERLGRVLGTYKQAGESPLQQVLKAVENGEVENVEEERVPTINPKY